MGGKGSGNPRMDLHKYGKKFSKTYQPDPEKLRGKRTKTILREVLDELTPQSFISTKEEYRELKQYLEDSRNNEDGRRAMLASALFYSIHGSSSFFKLLLEIEGSIGKTPEDLDKMGGLDKPIGEWVEDDWNLVIDMFKMKRDEAIGEEIDYEEIDEAEDEVDKVFKASMKKLGEQKSKDESK